MLSLPAISRWAFSFYVNSFQSLANCLTDPGLEILQDKMKLMQRLLYFCMMCFLISASSCVFLITSSDSEEEQTTSLHSQEYWTYLREERINKNQEKRTESTDKINRKDSYIVDPLLVHTGVLNINQIIIHVIQNLMNYFSSIVVWIFIAVFKHSTIDNIMHSSLGQLVFGEKGSNIQEIYTGIFEINNLIVHVIQNDLNAWASVIMWILVGFFLPQWQIFLVE